MVTFSSDSEISIPSATSYHEQLSELDFSGMAIDMALRTLLAKTELPKEAQQIDRAMQGFGQRYYECNPDLIDSPDTVYGIAFSILLLHTDAHNKNVRHKMSKETFIAHTKIIEGGENISPEVLDIMYDNVVSTEFSHAAPKNSQVHDNSDDQTTWASWAYRLLWMETGSNSTSSYPMTLAEDVRPRLREFMPEENTFHYTRQYPMDMMSAHMAFCHARPLCLAGVRSKNTSQQPTNRITRIAKAGVLERKQDLLAGGRRAPTRGWRSYGVALTTSQLLFFSDISRFAAWADGSPSPPIQEQHRHFFPHFLTSSSTSAVASSMTASAIAFSNPLDISITLQPLQAVSLENAVCIYDESYTKYAHTFRLVAGDGQQFLFRAKSDEDLDDWMTKINYASTQKTTKVRLRPMLNRHFGYLKEAVRSLGLKQELVQHSLERTLQLRRNLMALEPIQRSSKDRMVTHAEVVGKQLQDRRISIERITCYRTFCELALMSPFFQRSRTEPTLSVDRKSGVLDSFNDDDDGQGSIMLEVSSIGYRPRSKSTTMTEDKDHHTLHVMKTRGRNHSSTSLVPSICEDDDLSIFGDDGENVDDLIGQP